MGVSKNLQRTTPIGDIIAAFTLQILDSRDFVGKPRVWSIRARPPSSLKHNCSDTKVGIHRFGVTW